MKDRFKNPYFWFGLIGVICSAVNINIESITSWEILYKGILNVLGNPFLLLSVIMAITGVISLYVFYYLIKNIYFVE